MKTYETEKDILNVVQRFQTDTISREDWRCVEHLIVALYYLSHHYYDTAYVKMHEGIFKLLRAFEVDFSKKMPYDETLTVFLLKTVDKFMKTKNGYSIVEIHNKLIKDFDKDYPLKLYSREHIFSDEAQAKFIEGNL